MSERPHTIVIGAGLGGLTTAALLLQAGHQVTVLEAHVYPGGSAGTFYHQGYRFDAGATLAGGFFPGGPHARLAEMLDLEWPVQPVDPAWTVHLGQRPPITQWSDRQAWREERQAAFPGREDFWRRQEMLADISWQITSRPFPWPPASPADWLALARAVQPGTLRAAPYLLRTMGQLASDAGPLFRAFLDSQLLISAQTTADRAHALYASAALDLPRRGVNHVVGGMGALADTLVEWLRARGGEVHFRQQVTRLDVGQGRATAHTNKQRVFAGDFVVANVTPWALVDLLGEQAPPGLRRSLRLKKDQKPWGAFTLYLGLDGAELPPGPTHHQVVLDPTAPLGEGNSVFISLADGADSSRAPAGKRVATLSTHTEIEPWWQRQQSDRATYEAHRRRYTRRLLAAAEVALPGIRRAVDLALPGTPVTFAYYTRRPRGMVGGLPQTSLLSTRGPQTGLPQVWLVGDSIFPGQSTAGVTLGAMRVATAVLQAAGRGRNRVWPRPAPTTPSAEIGGLLT